MANNELVFYFAKGRLFLGTILSLVFIAMGGLLVYVAYEDGSLFFMAVGLLIIVLFPFFGVSNFLKLIRGNPYVILTEESIQLDPFTKSEAIIYFSNIERIEVSHVSFQSIIEIIVADEDEAFQQLSMHNKVRLFMNRALRFSLFSLNAKFIRKDQRATFLETFDRLIEGSTLDVAPPLETKKTKQVEKEFTEKYEDTPPINRALDRAYFIRAYGYGLLLFGIAFLLFYLLISKNTMYLLYSLVSLVFYPFAKAFVDWLFGFRLQHALEKQKGLTYYFRQLQGMLDFIVFHISLVLAPLGMLLLLIRFFKARGRE